MAERGSKLLPMAAPERAATDINIRAIIPHTFDRLKRHNYRALGMTESHLRQNKAGQVEA